MANPLAAIFLSSNEVRNMAVPGETITIRFPSPPDRASNVVIVVTETVNFVPQNSTKDQPTTRKRMLVEFRGRFVDGQYVNSSGTLNPQPPENPPITDAQHITIQVTTDGAPPAQIPDLPQPERVASHTLQLTVTGRVGRKQTPTTFQGKSLIHMNYPMAMIIPAEAGVDSTLGVVIAWAEQWERHNPRYRRLFRVPLAAVRDTIQDSDYDALVNACLEAGRFATAGVVALATGHGDEGDLAGGDNIAWCNLVPENRRPPTDDRDSTYKLDIDEAVLGDGEGPVVTGTSRKAKLRGVDRMGIEMSSRVRRFLLHTCSAGGSALFIQRLANRLQVPVYGHTETLEFSSPPGAPVLCGYVDPTNPQSEVNWPIHRLGPLARPGPTPNRHG